MSFDRSSKLVRRLLAAAAFGVCIGVATPAAAQGVQLPPEIVAMANNYDRLLSEGKWSAALVEAQKFEAAVRAKFGDQHVIYSVALLSVARTYLRLGRYDEALSTYQRAMAIMEKAAGPTSPLLANYLNEIALTRGFQGRYAEQEAIFNRLLVLVEPLPDKKLLGGTLVNVGELYINQGRFLEGERAYKRALAIAEQTAGSEADRIGHALQGLATFYVRQGRYDEAEQLARRCMAVIEKAYGKTHPEMIVTLNILAERYRLTGRDNEARSFSEQALTIAETTLGANHPLVFGPLWALADIDSRQNRHQDAETRYRRLLTLLQATSKSPPQVASVVAALGRLRHAQGRHAEAEQLQEQALSVLRPVVGTQHISLVGVFDSLSRDREAQNRIVPALEAARQATAILLAHGATEAQRSVDNSRSAGAIEQNADVFKHHVRLLERAARDNLETGPASMREGFDVAQWASHSSAAAAVQQMAARFAATGDALAALVREDQDLRTLFRDKDRKLLDTIGKSAGAQGDPSVDLLRKEIAEIERRLAANQAKLEREFPDYAALAAPKPLKLNAAQQLLGPQEALVFWLTGADRSWVFAVTRDGVDWQPIPVGEAALVAKIAAFRRGLDVERFQASLKSDKPELFDLALAHELYTTLLGPVESLVRDKRDLIVVPTGALTALPAHLMVTEPAATPASPTDVGAYRDAAWLLKRHAVSVLPSVASLRALRVSARGAPAAKPLIGFGDPQFGAPAPAPATSSGAQRGAVKVANATRTRSYTDYWRGAGVDRALLSQALPQLPDTADELNAVRAALGGASRVVLGKDATETAVKRAALSEFRVVYFATHGLVAGDVKGLAEPSLALTVPREATSLDDGLLTASEVAQLKLNAEWVVLSACNTAAGDKPGAEALSGLARAFFYAGSRSLLVSHWAVASDAATRLTTATFDLLKSDPRLGRAEALRRAMLAYLEDGSAPLNAYPAFWAPFTVIGEGAAR